MCVDHPATLASASEDYKWPMDAPVPDETRAERASKMEERAEEKHCLRHSCGKPKRRAQGNAQCFMHALNEPKLQTVNRDHGEASSTYSGKERIGNDF